MFAVAVPFVDTLIFQLARISHRTVFSCDDLDRIDVERKAVLKRGIDVLDTKHRCEGAPSFFFRSFAQRILTRGWRSQGSCPVRCVGCGRGTATSWTR